MSDKRWQLSFNGGSSWEDVNPLGPVRFVRERDLSKGHAFYRDKLNSDLLFSNADPDHQDFDLLRIYEEQPAERCTEIRIRRQRKCGVLWTTTWTGKFSAASGRWDWDKCQFIVRPDVVDDYTCLLDQMDRKVNVMDVEPTEVEAAIWPNNIQIELLRSGESHSSPVGWDLVDSQGLTLPTLGFLCPGGAVGFNIYWREYVVTNCVDGSAVSPVGTGWTIVPTIYSGHSCATTGKEAWARVPVISWPFPNDPLYVGQVVDSPPGLGSIPDYLPPLSPACSQWILVRGIDCSDDAVGIYVCLDDMAKEDYERGRDMRSVLEYLLEKSECEVTEVVSDFFEWSPIGDAAGYVPGENYVTGATNQLDHLFLFAKSDVVLPDATSPAVRAETTLKEFLGWLRTLFNVYWTITDDGKMRLEHVKFFAASQGLDLTTADHLARAGTSRMSYAHLKDEIPQFEELTFAEAQGTDFVGKPIEYQGPCMTPDRTEEYGVGNLTTDVGFIATDPDAINRRGFVIMAATFDGSTYTCIIDTGAITDTLSTNAPLSTANLMRDYWTWNRFLPSAIMNGEETVFDAYRSTIEQQGVLVPDCCDMVGWDPMNSVKTKLGENILDGKQGEVRRAELNDTLNMWTLTLGYSH